jgi:squalene-hopene/tetraprenyl-beta-curcumene cyclase
MSAVLICAFPRPAQVRAADEAPAIGPNSADEPLAAKVSLPRAAAFLDGVSVDWTRERKCGTCHTNYAYMIARPAVKDFTSPEMGEIRGFFEDRVAHWDAAEKEAKPRWDTEVVATAAALAINDAATTGKLNPLTRRALDRMWTLQRPNGSWDWLKCDWPPYEHDDYYGAVFAALGVGMAPDEYRKADSAQAGLAKLRDYLQKTPVPSLHHQAFLMWASMHLDGLMTSEKRAETIKSLLAAQRPDGGWNLASLGDWTRHDKTPNDKNGPSDGYGTGFVVYVLRQANVPADDPAIKQGVAWLESHQRASGRWFTRSLSRDKAHYITHAGTGFAILALKACEGKAAHSER